MIQHQSPSESDAMTYRRVPLTWDDASHDERERTLWINWDGYEPNPPEPVSNAYTFAIAVAGCVALAAVVWLCWRCL